MSAGAWAAYRSRIAGRTSPTRSRKSPEIKPFCGHRSTYSRQAHCIKDRVLLDITIISVAIGRAGIANSKTPNRHKSGLEVGLEKKVMELFAQNAKVTMSGIAET